MHFQIRIHNIGKEPKVFQVFGSHGERRPAEFEDIGSAIEALRIIEMLRSDSAYDGAVIVDTDGNTRLDKRFSKE